MKRRDLLKLAPCIPAVILDKPNVYTSSEGDVWVNGWLVSRSSTFTFDQIMWLHRIDPKSIDA